MFTNNQKAQWLLEKPSDEGMLWYTQPGTLHQNFKAHQQAIHDCCMEQLKDREADITPWKEATNRGPEELLANLESLEVAWLWARMSCAVIRARARARVHTLHIAVSGVQRGSSLLFLCQKNVFITLTLLYPPEPASMSLSVHFTANWSCYYGLLWRCYGLLWSCYSDFFGRTTPDTSTSPGTTKGTLVN